MYPASLGLLAGAIATLLVGLRAEGAGPILASILLSALSAGAAVTVMVRPPPRGAHRRRRSPFARSADVGRRP